MRSGTKHRVAIADIKPGETVVVYPGEAMLDQRSLTGESAPVKKGVGDKVFAATLVSDGKIYVKVEEVGANTRAARIVQLIETAPLQETKIENYAGKVAVVLPAFLVSGAMWRLTRSMTRTLPFIVVDFGTGLRVAAPTAVLASITSAARRGILFKSGKALEKLAQVDTVVIDKTGTLTLGEPEVVEVLSYYPEYSEDEVLALAASAEARLTHPAAQAIMRKAKERQLAIPERSESEYFIGMGVKAHVNGYFVHVGNTRLMKNHGISTRRVASTVKQLHTRALTPLLVAVDGKVIGVLAYEDPVRPESAHVVKELRQHGVREIVLLTGDNRHTAAAVAAKLQVDKFVAEAFPEDKARIVQDLKQQGHCVAVVGDGINDSPALAYADVAISLKGGSDIAQETADVVLMDSNLHQLIEAVQTAQQTMQLIRQNIRLVTLSNAASLLLATAGLLNPAGATVVSNGSTILAGVNGLRPLLNNNNGHHKTRDS